MSPARQKTNTVDSEAADRLEAVFQTVVAEARANPAFADRVRRALSDAAAERPKQGTGNRKKPAGASPPNIHAVNVLRLHGEQMLRGQLSNLRTKTELLRIAKRSGLRLTGDASKRSATRSDMIEGIVVAALQYVSQRGSLND
jgi:hypothetical protein